MKYLKMLVGLMLFISTVSFKHPFFVTVTEVEYSTQSKELGMSVKVYPDDLEETLRKFNGKKYDVIQGDKKQISLVLEEYLKKHLNIKLNGINKPYQFLGYEIDKESVLMYCNITNQAAVKSIEITADMMYEYKPEQTNIIHIKLDEKRESFRLTSPNTKAILRK